MNPAGVEKRVTITRKRSEDLLDAREKALLCAQQAFEYKAQ
jgi:hypothetical protein